MSAQLPLPGLWALNSSLIESRRDTCRMVTNRPRCPQDSLVETLVGF
jgi:hypothetical protein